MGSGIGNLLILAGILLVIAGVLAKFGLMGWFGHLPGDLRIKGEHGAFYFPLTTMILLSVVASLLLQLIRKF
ncbi:MAG: DUF2905 domain-containing protein [Campylobacterales bacterium]